MKKFQTYYEYPLSLSLSPHQLAHVSSISNFSTVKDMFNFIFGKQCFPRCACRTLCIVQTINVKHIFLMDDDFYDK